MFIFYRVQHKYLMGKLAGTQCRYMACSGHQLWCSIQKRAVLLRSCGWFQCSYINFSVTNSIALESTICYLIHEEMEENEISYPVYRRIRCFPITPGDLQWLFIQHNPAGCQNARPTLWSCSSYLEMALNRLKIARPGRFFPRGPEPTLARFASLVASTRLTVVANWLLHSFFR